MEDKVVTNLKSRASHLPEHGPVDENGREILLSLKNVDITFGKGENAVRAVKDATFDIYKGETFSLVGESGSGKTTIGRAVIRVNPLARGEIQYKGVRISGKTSRALAIDFVARPPYFDVTPTHKARTWLLDPRSPKVEPPAIIKNIRNIKRGGADNG